MIPLLVLYLAMPLDVIVLLVAAVLLARFTPRDVLEEHLTSLGAERQDGPED